MNLEPHAYTDEEIRRINEEDEHYYKAMERLNRFCHKCVVKQRVRYGALVLSVPGGFWTIVAIFT